MLISLSRTTSPLIVIDFPVLYKYFYPSFLYVFYYLPNQLLYGFSSLVLALLAALCPFLKGILCPLDPGLKELELHLIIPVDTSRRLRNCFIFYCSLAGQLLVWTLFNNCHWLCQVDYNSLALESSATSLGRSDHMLDVLRCLRNFIT